MRREADTVTGPENTFALHGKENVLKRGRRGVPHMNEPVAFLPVNATHHGVVNRQWGFFDKLVGQGNLAPLIAERIESRSDFELGLSGRQEAIVAGRKEVDGRQVKMDA